MTTVTVTYAIDRPKDQALDYLAQWQATGQPVANRRYAREPEAPVVKVVSIDIIDEGSYPIMVGHLFAIILDQKRESKMHTLFTRKGEHFGECWILAADLGVESGKWTFNRAWVPIDKEWRPEQQYHESLLELMAYMDKHFPW